MSEVRELVNTGAEACARDGEELRSRIHGLCDALMEHFGEEEEIVFPLLASALPDVAGELSELAQAHDAICGSAVRLASLADRFEQNDAGLVGSFGQLTTLFERLESAYHAHAQRERRVLRMIAQSLTAAEREALRNAGRLRR